MKRVLRGLGSLKLTIAVLVALGALFLAGLLIPQRAVLQRDLYEAWQARSPGVVAVVDALGLTDIYRSPLAIALWALFFANLAVVIGTRAPGIVRRARLSGEIPDARSAGFPHVASIAARPSPEDVAAFFAARRYAVRADGSRLRAVRNRWSPVATLVFHLSFVVVLAGGVTTVLTRFEGNLELGVGETYSGALEQFAGKPRIAPLADPPRAPFAIEAIEPELVGDVPVGVRIELSDAEGRRHRLEINHPYEVGNAAFVFKNLGVAPLLVVSDAEGRELFAGFIRLNVLQGRADTFPLLGRRFTAELFPDWERVGDQDRTRSQRMNDPALRLSVETATGRAFARTLRPGDVMPLGPYTLRLVELRYWAKLYARSERGLWIVWTGFAIAALALVWRLGLYRRDYLVALGDGAVVVAGRADYYRALFEDEFAGTVRDLEAALSAPPRAA